jgi:hypothetical protein
MASDATMSLVVEFLESRGLNQAASILKSTDQSQGSGQVVVVCLISRYFQSNTFLVFLTSAFLYF